MCLSELMLSNDVGSGGRPRSWDVKESMTSGRDGKEAGHAGRQVNR